jgi:hypothetical protein
MQRAGAFMLFGLAAVLAVFFAKHHLSKEEGRPIGIAFGNPNSGQNSVELHVVVSMGMPRIQEPRLGPTGGLQWFEWIDEHFDLRDPSGAKVPMKKMGFSNLINDRQAMTPEFFIGATLTPGVKYRFDYIPVLGEPLRYRHEFVAPAGKTDFVREDFRPSH